MKNLNRQRTVTIAETNEVVVKKKDAILLKLNQAKRKQTNCFLIPYCNRHRPRNPVCVFLQGI